jgi:hypothetical protein
MSESRKLYEEMKAQIMEDALLDPRLDIGPAKRWYVKSLFPPSVFTKKLTHCREVAVRNVFRTLRPEQRKVALRHGYNRGLKV